MADLDKGIAHAASLLEIQLPVLQGDAFLNIVGQSKLISALFADRISDLKDAGVMDKDGKLNFRDQNDVYTYVYEARQLFRELDALAGGVAPEEHLAEYYDRAGKMRTINDTVGRIDHHLQEMMKKIGVDEMSDPAKKYHGAELGNAKQEIADVKATMAVPKP